MKELETLLSADKVGRMVILTDEEAKDLAKTITEAIASLEDATPFRASWSDEARDWASLLLGPSQRRMI